eukprot:GHUV01033956.1.p1 GENE.GHUV01033956.1~~GHUV01033956.1.p1  ORF type:complete len:201 (-),score=49.56 GHUV01033956.1:218-820(-)
MCQMCFAVTHGLQSCPHTTFFGCHACRSSFADVFEYLESCQAGVPATELLQRGNSLTHVSSGNLLSSPTAVQIVDQQLYGLKLSAEKQLRLVQEQLANGQHPEQGFPALAAVINGADIAWSEVTYGGAPDAYHVQPLQDMQQRPAQLQHQRQLQGQHAQPPPINLQQEQGPAQRQRSPDKKPSRPANADMGWSEVTYGHI